MRNTMTPCGLAQSFRFDVCIGNVLPWHHARNQFLDLIQLFAAMLSGGSFYWRMW